MNNAESFAALMANDKTVAGHFEKLVTTLKSASPHPITRDQLMSLTSVRMAALTLSDVDQGQYDSECADNFEIFRRSNEESAQLQILLDKNIQEAAQAEKALGLADMKPDERLAYGREHGLISTKTAAPPQAPTGEALARLLAENAALPRSMRISHARAHGITG